MNLQKYPESEGEKSIQQNNSIKFLLKTYDPAMGHGVWVQLMSI